MEEEQEQLLCASAALLDRVYILARQGLSPVTTPTAQMVVTTYREVRLKLGYAAYNALALLLTWRVRCCEPCAH